MSATSVRSSSSTSSTRRVGRDRTGSPTMRMGRTATRRAYGCIGDGPPCPARVLSAARGSIPLRMTDVSFAKQAARSVMESATQISVPLDQLDRRDREILAFERQWWKYAGAKEQAIRELFDMSATRYYQVLNALLDKPEAMAADPLLIKRLRRLRTSRQRTRAARRLGFEPW